MKLYLAARYSRRAELHGYAQELRRFGHEVTSRWHEGDAHLATEDDLLGDDQTLAIRLASEDWDDLERADLVLSFTDPPRSQPNRGGRQVEYGIALALGKRCWLVGPREHVFHALADRMLPGWPGGLAFSRELQASMDAELRSGL